MLELTHTDERVLQQRQRRPAPQPVDTIAATLGVTREVVVLSLARLQLAELAESRCPSTNPAASVVGERSAKAGAP